MIDNNSFNKKISSSASQINIIGNTIESSNYLITLDEFWFAINPDTIISPFDFVSVKNILDTVTVGIVKELRTVREDRFVIRSDNNEEGKKFEDKILGYYTNNTSTISLGIRIARVAVMTNISNGGFNDFKELDSSVKDNYTINHIIRMPVGIGSPVRFSTDEEIIKALGIPKMENPIYAGIIEMSNGNKIPIPMSMSYLAGPDSAHVNATGISGNLKTSYLLFLLHSIYQNLKKTNNVAIIYFNTRQEDLLHVHEPSKISFQDKELYDLLQLSPEPFENVTYFLPRGSDGMPISSYIPNNHKTYSYELGDIYDRLELLLSSETFDPHYNLSSIINYIYEYWPLYDVNGKIVNNWNDLFSYKNYPEEIITQKSSFQHFLGYLQKFRKSSMFTNKREKSIYLGNEIKKIKPGQIFVIDIAMIPTIEEQSLVVGDVMKNIDELYSSRYSMNYTLPLQDKKEKNITHNMLEDKLILFIFIDEINRFLPLTYPSGIRSSVAEQIIKTLIAGKTRNTILFSAQQFKSGVDTILNDSTGIHVIAKLGLSELDNSAYAMLDDSTKRNIANMDRGELVMIQSAFRHPIKVVIPKPPYKRRR